VVFLLTDGQFENQPEIFALVQSNVSRVTVYTIGIGCDVIERDLTEIAARGQGRCLIAKDEQSTALQAQVIDLLQSTYDGTSAT
jgi:secreted protein with Ig-like and vWFA domain